MVDTRWESERRARFLVYLPGPSKEAIKGMRTGNRESILHSICSLKGSREEHETSADAVQNSKETGS